MLKLVGKNRAGTFKLSKVKCILLSDNEVKYMYNVQYSFYNIPHFNTDLDITSCIT